MVQGAAQAFNVTDAVPGDKAVLTRYTNCSAASMVGPANPDKTAVYNVNNAGYIPAFGTLFTTQIFTMHTAANPGQWRFCYFMYMANLWLTVAGKYMTIIPRPTFSPTITVAGSVTPLSFVGGGDNDYVVISYNGCKDARVNNTALMAVSHNSVSRQAITNNQIYTHQNMTDTLANHSYNVVICYATKESGGDSSDDYSALDIPLNSVPPLTYSCTDCITTQPRRTVVQSPQDFTFLAAKPNRGDQVAWTMEPSCDNITEGVTPRRSAVYNISTASQSVSLHTTAVVGSWYTCMRASWDGVWTVVNHPGDKSHVMLTIDSDTAPRFSGTGSYKVSENARLTLQDLQLIDPDYVYKTKNAFLVMLNCTNGTMTIGTRTGLLLRDGNRGQSIQSVAFESTLEAANTALSSVIYAMDGRRRDAILVEVYDIGSVTSPVLTANKTIVAQYDCTEAAAPRVNSAVWDNNNALVLVTFDRITTMGGLANPGTISCGTMFTPATINAFGASPVCTWASATTFTVQLGSGMNFRPGDSLAWADRVTRACETSWNYLTAATVTSAPVAPKAVKTSVTAPGSLGSCDDLVVDAGLSTGYGGLPLTYRWSIDMNVTTQTNVTNATAGTWLMHSNTGPVAGFPKTTAKFSLTNAVIASWGVVSSLPFTLTVTDYLGQTALKSISVYKSSEPLPLVYIDGNSNTQSLRRATRQRLRGSIQVADCAALSSSDWDFSWSVPGDPALSSALIGSAYGNTQRTLVIPANAMSPSTLYTFRMTVSSRSNSTLSTYDEARVYASLSDLQTEAVGGDSRTSSLAKSVTVSVTGTDPDSNSDPWSFGWTCALAPRMGPCPTATGGTLSLSPITLQSSGLSSVTVAANSVSVGDYVFSVTTAKGNRTATAVTSTVSFVAGNPPVVAITKGGNALRRKVNLASKITFVGTASTDGSGSVITYAWSTTSNGLNLAYPAVTATPLTAPNLAIQPNTLTEGQTYTFRLTATAASSSGYSTTSVTVNRPPTNTAGGLTVSPTVGTSANTSFVLTTTAWNDDPEDLPILYTFYRGVSATQNVALSAADEKLSLSTTLSEGYGIEGAMTLSVRACDNLGAYREATANVRVTSTVMTAAEEETMVTAALDTMASLQASGDSTSMLNLLSSTAAQMNAAPTVGSNGTKSATQTETAKTQRLTMLNLLAETAARVDTSDASVLDQLATAAMQSTLTASEVSPEAQDAVLNLMSLIIPDDSNSNSTVARDVPVGTLSSMVSALGNVAEASHALPAVIPNATNATTDDNSTVTTGARRGVAASSVALSYAALHHRRSVEGRIPFTIGYGGTRRDAYRLFAGHPRLLNVISTAPRGPQYLRYKARPGARRDSSGRRLLASESTESQGCSKYSWDVEVYYGLSNENQRYKYNTTRGVMINMCKVAKALLNSDGGIVADADATTCTTPNLKAETKRHTNLQGQSMTTTASSTSDATNTAVSFPNAYERTAESDTVIVQYALNPMDWLGDPSITVTNNVTSLEVLGTVTANLAAPIAMTWNLATNSFAAGNVGTESFSCTYWDTATTSWSQKGVFMTAITATSITCHSFHLTDFSSTLGIPVIPNPFVANPLGDMSALTESETKYLMAGLLLVALIVLFMILTSMLTARYRAEVAAQGKGGGSPGSKYQVEETPSKITTTAEEELPTLTDYLCLEHSLTGIFAAGHKLEYGPVRRLTSLLCQVCVACLVCALWLQSGRANFGMTAVASLLAIIVSIPVYKAVKYVFQEISKISSGVDGAPAHVQAQFASKLRIVAMCHYALIYIVVGFCGFVCLLITSDLETDEMRAWIYSCCGAMGFSIIVCEPLILIAHWLYEIKYADVVEDEDVIADISINQAGPQLGGLGMKFASSAMKDGMRQAAPDDIDQPEEPEPDMPPAVEPVLTRPTTPVRVETPRRPQTPMEAMPAMVPMLALERVPEPETPEYTPTPPTPPPAAVAMAEIARMREELKARAERARRQVEAQVAQQVAQQIQGRQPSSASGGFPATSGSHPTSRHQAGGLPALAALRPLRPDGAVVAAADRLEGLMAQRRDAAPSRADRLQRLALSPFARNNSGLGSRQGAPGGGLGALGGSPLPPPSASSLASRGLTGLGPLSPVAQGQGHRSQSPPPPGAPPLRPGGLPPLQAVPRSSPRRFGGPSSSPRSPK